jgi:hypothetical protein
LPDLPARLRESQSITVALAACGMTWWAAERVTLSPSHDG